MVWKRVLAEGCVSTLGRDGGGGGCGVAWREGGVAWREVRCFGGGGRGRLREGGGEARRTEGWGGKWGGGAGQAVKREDDDGRGGGV